MDNRAVTIKCYKQALQCDVYSYEAFEALVQNKMLKKGNIEGKKERKREKIKKLRKK